MIVKCHTCPKMIHRPNGSTLFRPKCGRCKRRDHRFNSSGVKGPRRPRCEPVSSGADFGAMGALAAFMLRRRRR